MGIVYIAGAIAIALVAVAGYAFLKTALESLKDRFRE